jgi:hypothetical protein
MQVTAAHRQHLIAALQVNVRGLVEAAREMADRVTVHHHRALHLHEVRIELFHQLLQRRANERLARLAGVVAPGD